MKRANTMGQQFYGIETEDGVVWFSEGNIKGFGPSQYEKVLDEKGQLQYVRPDTVDIVFNDGSRLITDDAELLSLTLTSDAPATEAQPPTPPPPPVPEPKKSVFGRPKKFVP